MKYIDIVNICWNVEINLDYTESTDRKYWKLHNLPKQAMYFLCSVAAFISQISQERKYILLKYKQ